jgi:divalent metal cation (Fe/Co/Zn/Cd) transporter
MSIGILIAVFSLWLMKNIKDFIVGVSASEEIKELIKKIVLKTKEVEQVLDLKAIVIGSNRLLVNLEIHLKSGLITEQIEELIDKVKANIKREVPSVYHVQIELETPDHEIKLK